MRRPNRCVFALAALCALNLGSVRLAAAQGAPVMQVAVDATRAAQRYYRVKVTLPATPGPFTFVYPDWIPGYHAAAGPIEGVVNLRVFAGATPLDWRRDLVDMYAVHTTVPAGASSIDVDFDLVGADSKNGQTWPVSTPNLAVIEFSNLLVYPQGATAEGTQVQARLNLPEGWKYGTALGLESQQSGTLVFAQTSLYTLLDSPVTAGLYFNVFPLSDDSELDVAADGAAALKIVPAILTGMKHLVVEAPALYGSKHYRNYHFLLALTDSIAPDGLEHHESSDNRAPEDYMSDADAYRTGADLLPHEYSHSWNGKYRRPGDLYQPDYQIPERDDLLWVYEGLNQYNGELLATRARLLSFRDQLESLAGSAAAMDTQNGRLWRPLRDTADAAPFLYSAPSDWSNIRRGSDDFYTEGDLIWLDADVTIRKLTNGAKSLDDFEKLWGAGGSRVPSVNKYTAEDVYQLLNQVAPYDWAGFFRDRVATVQPRAPLGGITGGGYKLVYVDKPSEYQKTQESNDKRVDARYSLGLTIAKDDGTIRDVVGDSAAFRAGLAPGMKILAVDGREWSGEVFHQALAAHAGLPVPLELTTSYVSFVRTYQLPATEGERYPHLERVPGTPDLLSRIYAPRTFVAAPEPSGG
jgi:predicted metalloprotease with PDZ domain